MNTYIKILMLLGFFTIFLLSSCKDPVSPKADITVLYGIQNKGLPEINTPVEGAIVTVYANSTEDKPGYIDPYNKTEEIVKTTDASGRCSFDFPIENILLVKAEKPQKFGNVSDTLYGEDVLSLREDKISNKTIHLRQFKSTLE